MADTSATRARRLIAILHRLIPGERIELEQLANELDVSVGDLTRDLETLTMCGVAPYDPAALVPLIIEDGVIDVFGELPALDRTVRLNAAEARALATALQTAGFSPSDPLLARLLDAAAGTATDPHELAAAVQAAVSPATDVYPTLVHAAHQHVVVAISYLPHGRPEATEREIEPLAVVCDKGTWYVEAYCRLASGLRTFRVDRVLSATATTERFEPREFTSAGCALPLGDLPRARVRFAHAEDADEREWPGITIVERAGDGVTAEVPYAGTNWIARKVVARLGSAEVLGPDEVRHAVARLAVRIMDGPERG